jgi:hypothetical protein
MVRDVSIENSVCGQADAVLLELKMSGCQLLSAILDLATRHAARSPILRKSQNAFLG